MRLVFFLSGFASLAFEAVWFRLAGQSLGNSVRASSVVLAAFMAGLALGNALAGRHGHRVASPLRAYALLEVLVGLTGVGLVLLLPALGPALAPAFARLLDQPLLTDALRAAVAFLLMVVPTTAMGATLPLVARSEARDGREYGAVLGSLYGWNTLGGMAGALACEAWIVGIVGLSGAALVAGSLNVVAAAGAFLLSRRWVTVAAAEEPGRRLEPPALLLLVAAFGAGGGLLALEVVWFRFLQLFVYGSSLAFAVMLAVVLLGIGAGSLVAGAWLARRPADARHLPLLALATGGAVVLAYAAFPAGNAAHTDWVLAALAPSLRLMLLPAMLSGAFFTACGSALRTHLAGTAEATGALTLANTTGAMLGALAGGFLAIPLLGVEGSLVLLALSYAAVAALTALALGRVGDRGVLAGVAVLLGAALLLPVGLMRERFLPASLAPFLHGGARVVAFREGVAETVSYVRSDWGGQPLSWQLVTNGHSMTASGFYARRYMGLYAHWAVAVRPSSRKALLISYGLGNTASALRDWPGFEAIDVVDTSADILAMSSVAFARPEDDPLKDPRLRVHVEDGRFFLLTTAERFDVITAEPPPPRGAGITNLYSREYFALVHDRLVPGGVVTYWLPVNQLDQASAKAITRAFCDAFADCSLWNAAGHDWMLTGTRGLAGPLPASGLARAWAEPRFARGLRAAGVETPEQLGALFLADAAQLAAWTQGVAPLDDDHPHRLTGGAGAADVAAYRALAASASQRFAASGAMARLWPAELRPGTLDAFRLQEIFDRDFFAGATPADLEAALATSSHHVLPLLLLDSEPRVVEIAQAAERAGVSHPAVTYHLAADALARRDYAEAARRFEAAGVTPAGHPTAPYVDLARRLAAR